MAFFYISAAHKSSGKTTISVGLAGAFARQGLNVQTFKKGPDYIDPLWLGKASGRPCYNLDFNTMEPDEILATFTRHGSGSDIILVEGNKGLYDGVDLEGADSNAAMAKLLGAPVVLVLDCSGITRGIAPLLQGYISFDPDIEIAGVILNKVANARHEKKLRDVVTCYVRIPVLGVVFRDNSLLAPERHLGLVPPEETLHQGARLEELASLVGQSVDLSQVRDIAGAARFPSHEPLPSIPLKGTGGRGGKGRLRIGIMRDSAFGFYYADDLAALENYGAELVFLNALEDRALPLLDGLFIGGGLS